MIRVDTVGTEKHPVIIIDNALRSPNLLVEDAVNAQYTVRSPFYPGPRAKAPAGYVQGLSHALSNPIREVFGWQADQLRATESNFSLVTTPPEGLTPPQRIPHYDADDADVVAVLHYLCEGNNGGTGFYRHKKTGFESITAERKQAYTDAMSEDVSGGYMPPPGYLNGPSALFDRIGGYECIFNRILIYRGIMLHSGNIPEDLPLSADPRKGRLTANTFIRRVKATSAPR